MLRVSNNKALSSEHSVGWPHREVQKQRQGLALSKKDVKETANPQI
jgi:hypothetical protein